MLWKPVLQQVPILIEWKHYIISLLAVVVSEVIVCHQGCEASAGAKPHYILYAKHIIYNKEVKSGEHLCSIITLTTSVPIRD